MKIEWRGMNGWKMGEWMKDGGNELRMEGMNDVPTFLSTGVLGGCCVTVGGNNPLSWEPVDIREFGVFTAAVTVAFPPGNSNCNNGNNRIRSISSGGSTLENFGIHLHRTQHGPKLCTPMGPGDVLAKCHQACWSKLPKFYPNFSVSGPDRPPSFKT